MRWILSCCLLIAIGVFPNWAQEMKVTAENAKSNIEQEGELLVQPKSEMTIAPTVYQAYKASQKISFLPGVRIRPTNTGWFSAQLRDVPKSGSGELVDNLQMDVFPNPVEEDFLHVRLVKIPETPWSVRLFSMDGREVDGFNQVVIEGSEAQISLNGLPQGIYLLKALIADEVVISKVVKQ